MPKLKLQMTMSLDGYVAGPAQNLENPLGKGAQTLHAWAFATKRFREAHGMEGGDETGLDNAHVNWDENVGASIMGRNMFGPVRGPWDEPWDGWWGDEPPFHHDVFVLTHHPRASLILSDTTFHFVTGGIDDALDRAREAAAGKDISIGGGAETARQYLAAGLVDKLEVHVVPVLLGTGERLFDGPISGFEPVDLEASPAAAHFRWTRTS
jgi:dihydrofolate reductase